MSFTDELADNTKQAMVAALLRTVVSEPKRTIGNILDALEKETGAAEYLPDLFRDVTILQLVQAAAEQIRETGVGLDGGPEGMPPAEASGRAVVGNPPDEDSGPEDNLEDEGGAEEEQQSSEPPKKKKKKKKKKKDKEKGKGKGKGNRKSKGKDDSPRMPPKKKKDKDKDKDKDKEKEKGKGKGKGKGKDGHIDLVDPDNQKAYQSAIVKHLRKGKCIDYESGHSSTEIRKDIGGDPKQFREHVDTLIESERVDKGGEARGVRYFID